MKAIIDLDWLNAEIDNIEGAINNGHYIDCGKLGAQWVLAKLKTVRSKCEPIEEPIREGFSPPSGILTKVEPLPTTCLNEWENPVYCPLVGYCQKCENK